jgi:hypothetical protein
MRRWLKYPKRILLRVSILFLLDIPRKKGSLNRISDDLIFYTGNSNGLIQKSKKGGLSG